jgi:hypothetical protein
MDNGMVLVLFGVIGLVLMFAQLKLFSIDASLKRMVELLERESRQESTEAHNTLGPADG